MKVSPVTPALLAVVKQRVPTVEVSQLPESVQVQRAMLGDILIASNDQWNEHVLTAVDEVWRDEQSTQEQVSWTDIQERVVFYGTEVAVWRGDITQLEMDAIVNAANDQGLGCFVPDHRCIDNTIHRRAGPRLREACRLEMDKRTVDLKTGTKPIVTDAFYLPSKHVIHVTGPNTGRRRVNDQDRHNLVQAYRGSLEACVSNNIRSVAFPGISTGLFGFPKDEAANIALMTVLDWLRNNPGQLDAVVFDVFSQEDETIYAEKLGYLQSARKLPVVNGIDPEASRHETLSVAKRWIDEADAVLICAGAGMSVKEGEMVYVNEQDFAEHYPFMPRWGYNTGYETMGLLPDRRVPETTKWAFWARHMHNMRWGFTPNNGYDTLLDMVKEKDYFVLTSNVDGCFETSGFDKDRIYTPQGEWTYYQCRKPCRMDAVFESRPLLDQILPHVSAEGTIPEEMIPKCPYCGGDVFGNVRAGSSFLHTKYEHENDAIREWMDRQIQEDGKKVVVIEVGAGFNTPMVTRLPVESFVRELGADRGHLIRINPSDPQVPSDMPALSIAEGWQVLHDIRDADSSTEEEEEENESATTAMENRVARRQKLNGMTVGVETTMGLAQRFGHFDWNIFLENLKN